MRINKEIYCWIRIFNKKQICIHFSRIQSKSNWQIFPLLEIENISGDISSSIILDLAHLFSSIREVILLSCCSNRDSILDFSPCCDSFLSFDSIINCINSWSFYCFSAVNILPTFFIIHQSIESVTPFFLENGLKELLLCWHIIESISPKIFENIVSSCWGDFSLKNQIIIILSSGFVW